MADTGETRRFSVFRQPNQTANPFRNRIRDALKAAEDPRQPISNRIREDLIQNCVKRIEFGDTRPINDIAIHVLRSIGR